jgi:hypothetical protein
MRDDIMAQHYDMNSQGQRVSMSVCLVSIAQVAGSILARLEQALLPRERLAGALVTAPHVLNYYMSYLVAVSVAQLVPHQLQATQEDLQVSSSARGSKT